MKKSCLTTCLGAALLLLTLPGASGANDTLAEVENLGDTLVFHPVVEFAELILTVTGPCNFEFVQRVTKGEPAFRLDATTIDGRYTYSLVRVESIDPGIIDILRNARAKGDDETPKQLCRDGKLPGDPGTQSAGFLVSKGQIIFDPKAVETRGRLGARESGPAMSATTPRAASNGVSLSPRDFVINDDLIVDGSACIGFDCVNGEVFSFDTIRLKENNLRIKFDDTSVAASFPRNDWQLTANESANGGQSKFSIEDISGGRTPFTVEANARSHSLYVDDGGRIGSRTSTPSVELHTIDGDTPTLRLQQDGSSGFEPQTWDVAGNETNFFVRDVTNGSALPFRIRPGAPSSAIFIDVDGDVGMGTSSPSAPLHVREQTGANATLVSLENNGPITFSYVNTGAGGETWNLNALNGGFAISISGTGVNEFFITDGGNVEVPQGTVVHTSSRTMKHDVTPVDAQAVLARVASLPLSSWRYNRSAEDLHVGPMAEDFYAAFGLGSNEKSIALSDTAGVALAAIQGLNEVVRTKDARIDSLSSEIEHLESENATLARRLEALESLVSSLVPTTGGQ